MKIKNRTSIIDRIADRHYNGQYVVTQTFSESTNKENTNQAIMNWKTKVKTKSQS